MSKNLMRSNISSKLAFKKDAVAFLQLCNLEGHEDIWNEHIKKLPYFELPRNTSHLKSLHGLLAVFQCLMAYVSENNVSRLSYMKAIQRTYVPPQLWSKCLHNI